ncbi:hypothetical protein FTUN_5801 [Frigoriglobus tundricola]|uniref:Uncharacterized protein n=1 Tax=Frigoriglobus tundricola TaxID=2774151 RepID=A0A6M5YVU6_9BACT|nr:hypothetical protein FTUN_5801 [Frigoriglobus tundricola]
MKKTDALGAQTVRERPGTTSRITEEEREMESHRSGEPVTILIYGRSN